MNIIKQTVVEIKNLLKMKFILIIGILVLIIGFAGPILSIAMNKYYENKYADRYEEQIYDSITVDGVTIDPENPLYYEINYYVNEAMMYVGDITADERTLTQELVDTIAAYYVGYATEIIDGEDYRISMVWSGRETLTELFALQKVAEGVSSSELINVVNMISYVENLNSMMELSDEDLALKIKQDEEFLAQIAEAVESNDFDIFIDCMIIVENQKIESLEKQIENQEAAVIANPDMEESANQEIERLQTQIDMAYENTIPTWEYRRENELYPNSNDWRNNALSEIEWRTSELANQIIMTEEEYENDYWTKENYGSYEDYVAAMKKNEIKIQEKIMLAQNSLDAGKPDMSFIYNGARQQVNGNLFYALIVAFFAILVGGFIIANEFQTGTIRLLMIRPRTRIKVYSTKFMAGLIVVYGIYIGGMICNIIVNGIIWGFGDYLNPNYTANGEVSFFAMITGRILICSVTIIFSYALAFAISALVKNSAIAIALPGACIIGSVLVTSMFAYSKYAKILAYTPLPYINFSDFYAEYGSISTMIERGADVSVALGVVMLLGLSVLCFIVGLLHFKNKDITN
ncbi:MAG: ABC transporter permease subunit [Eubacteriales bacterium]